MDISNLLLSWDEYNKKEFSIPHIYSIKNEKQELIYVGMNHCYDSKNYQFEILRKEWAEFYERHKNKVRAKY